MRTELIRNSQVIYTYGEYAIIVLLWHEPDFAAGLIGRCPECFVAGGEIAEAYGSETHQKCTTCYGTGFGPGPRAKIIRPILWFSGDDDSIVQQSPHGAYINSTAQMQTTADYRIRNNDYVIRADNSRWRTSTANLDQTKTGFQFQTWPRQMIGTLFAGMVREDQSSVAYIIPPTDSEDITELLDVPFPRQPLDYSTFEVINGPLITSD